jgi:hypothetical protein
MRAMDAIAKGSDGVTDGKEKGCQIVQRTDTGSKGMPRGGKPPPSSAKEFH